MCTSIQGSPHTFISWANTTAATLLRATATLQLTAQDSSAAHAKPWMIHRHTTAGRMHPDCPLTHPTVQWGYMLAAPHIVTIAQACTCSTSIQRERKDANSLRKSSCLWFTCPCLADGGCRRYSCSCCHRFAGEPQGACRRKAAACGSMKESGRQGRVQCQDSQQPAE